MKQTDIVKRAILGLGKIETAKHILAGFDGLVDEIVHVVDKRKTHDEFQRIKDIASFSRRVASGAGISANIEMVPERIKLGGNGPIMANALIGLGQEVTYIGSLGKHYIHPVFRSFADACRKVISITEPGHTDALEFMDGKIKMNKTSSFNEINIENLLKRIPAADLARIIEETDLLAITNWSMLPGLSGIMDHVSKLIKKAHKKPKVYVDLGDPKKRIDSDTRKVLTLVSGMPAETQLAMNMSESTTISLVMGIKEDDIMARAEQIRLHLGIQGVVIHPVNGAALSHVHESVWVKGPHTRNPKLSTGAGDNFNAGYCLGWIAGLDPGQCLTLGVCTSGYYVRNGASPNRQQLLDFMQKWLDTGCTNL